MNYQKVYDDLMSSRLLLKKQRHTHKKQGT